MAKMPETGELEQTIYREIAKVVPGSKKPRATLDSRLREDLKVNSLGLVALITSLCEGLDISILRFTEMDLARLERVKDVVGLLQQEDRDPDGERRP